MKSAVDFLDTAWIEIANSSWWTEMHENKVYLQVVRIVQESVGVFLLVVVPTVWIFSEWGHMRHSLEQWSYITSYFWRVVRMLWLKKKKKKAQVLHHEMLKFKHNTPPAFSHYIHFVLLLQWKIILGTSVRFQR